MNLTAEYLKKHLPDIRQDNLIDDIVQHGLLQSLPAGQTILTDRQYIDHIPLISKGGLKVVRHTEEDNDLFLYFLRPGETCAMTLSSCLKRETSKVRAKTITATDIVMIPVERVYYYTRHFAGWNEFTLLSFQLKFDSMLAAFEGLAFLPLEERTTAYLRDIAIISGNNDLTVTHEALAEDLGASRVGMSRILKRLEEEGILRLGRGHITLSDPLPE
ncbi:Crp/Fnr family transcriptional regulator [Neolewinella aurantiaca]|uniref:Crp/Fnr family transcriptional regulator n=1 Tax=Neolewinella aurantiaca TaxID=2602767 RepID=A0A5C7G0I1_9BACT|nr:Crp/Fnr family transcriptional regulator [Neolewinella aurantiaca]TXF91693.1 Crp/Fnr family transcriptional regulator [Neolewinella aurantiaca]